MNAKSKKQQFVLRIIHNTTNVWKSKLKSTWNIKVSLTYFYKLLIDVSIAPNKKFKLNSYTNYPKNHVWHITWKVFMLHYNTFSPKDEKHFVAFCVILYDIKHVTYIVMRCKFTKNYSLHKLNLFWQKLLTLLTLEPRSSAHNFATKNCTLYQMSSLYNTKPHLTEHAVRYIWKYQGKCKHITMIGLDKTFETYND